MLVEFEQNSYCPNYTKFRAFWQKKKKKKKTGFFIIIFQKRIDAILEDVSAAEITV